ncbi:MAG: XRE family transcriptional regulator [Eubacteriales bacterium]|jgi:transcriptional regulator with XRE-family HTH domain
MDYLEHNISENLHRYRTSHGWSLDNAAEQTGVSKSMLAQIEKGCANPSIGTLGKIATGLRISFNDLISPPPMDTCTIDVLNTEPIKKSENNYRVWNCFPYEDNQMVEIYRIDLEEDGVYSSGSHGERTREYLCVTEGEVIIRIDGKSYPVPKDSCFRFESDRPHQYIGKKKSNSLVMFFVSC